jgi:hypothetical protein
VFDSLYLPLWITRGFHSYPALGSSVGRESTCMLTHIAIMIRITLPMKNGTTTRAEYPIVRIKNAIVRIFVFIGIPFPSCQFLIYSPNQRFVMSQWYHLYILP